MSEQFTEALRIISPRTPREALEKYAQPLRDAMRRYGIVNVVEMAAFLANVAHESCGFTRVRENLNYSVEGLLSTFPKYFKDEEQALKCAHNPQKIANIVYGNRRGNCNPGDGYRFIGRGLIQLTGRDNYTAYSMNRHNDLRLLEHPELLEEPTEAAMSAAWFWYYNNLGRVAATGNFQKVCRLINGGTNGMEDREKYYDRACKVCQSLEA
jgi:putative chitinase